MIKDTNVQRSIVLPKEINEKIKDLDADYYAESLAAQQAAEKKRLDDLRAALNREMAARQHSMSGMGATGVWMAMITDWVCRTSFFVPRMLSGKWKTKYRPE